jgi:hypothetical protein
MLESAGFRGERRELAKLNPILHQVKRAAKERMPIPVVL